MKKGMSWIIVVIAVLVVIGIFLFANGYKTPSSPSNNTAGTNSVIIRGMAFSPSPILIKVGDTVTWTNMDSVSHTVTSDSGRELDSLTLSTGSTYSHTFASPGTYAYHCKIHTYMKGIVNVQ